ncbi:MAG: Gfo/Idh/MocA family oxidoreductase [Saprospiraceae bacterium]|nr:Gfo/Idh/MocA family oxidoreductase [Saprospiraceae bacterium]
MKRRDFLNQSSKIVGSAAIAHILPSTVVFGNPFFPADKIQFALIGCKGMGWSNLTALLKTGEAECVALCDVDENILSQRTADLEKLGGKATTYTDYRKVLERKDIDAVIVATPDHWHALITMEACMAGKDVYVEKPLAITVEECNAMVAAAQKYQRAVQVGQWQRSQQHFQDAVAYVRSGKLGEIFGARTWIASTQPKLPVVADGPVPTGAHYDLWLGPAPKRPFNQNRFHYTFRWYWDYAGGLMTDWGVHLLDIPVFALGNAAPKSIFSSGGKRVYPGDARETPDVQMTVYEFDKFQLTWEHAMGSRSHYSGKGHGISFQGEKGVLTVNRSGWEVIPHDEKQLEAMPWTKQSDNGLEKHMVNFVEVIKSRKLADLKCSVEEGAKIAILCNLGNASLRVGKPLQWDAAKQLTNDKKANKILAANYQNGWKLPTV